MVPYLFSILIGKKTVNDYQNIFRQNKIAIFNMKNLTNSQIIRPVIGYKLFQIIFFLLIFFINLFLRLTIM